ncbi:MAG TPA: putative toxin-antitoxin system toxin component, PIN family [Candidatus Deferrimicrobiaceae bacterium]|jgi:putative PIN family toxin of toxin-antitoxin system
MAESRLRIVLDANVYVSAAYGGIPLDAVRKAFAIGTVYLSVDTARKIEKTVEKLVGRFGHERAGKLAGLWKALFGHCRMVEVPEKLSLCRDPKDDAYLSLCGAVGADILMTGDKDLLEIDPRTFPGSLRQLRIYTPRQFMESE